VYRCFKSIAIDLIWWQIGWIMENVYGELEEHLFNEMGRQTLTQIVEKIE
jgi:hypothetical protein